MGFFIPVSLWGIFQHLNLKILNGGSWLWDFVYMERLILEIIGAISPSENIRLTVDK